MKKNILEKIQKVQEDQENIFKIFNNDGTVKDGRRELVKEMNKDIISPLTLERIEEVLYSDLKYYASKHKFDKGDMTLQLGLIYNKKDVEKDNCIKEGVEPYEGIVYYKASNVNCYLNDKKQNKYDITYAKDGIINYEYLIKSLKNDGLEYDSPDTFEEFKNAIISGKKFNTKLTANIPTHQNEQELEEQPTNLIQKSKAKIKRLFTR